MKRVSSQDLARVAMHKGAVVSHGGQRINASGERQVVPLRRAEPEPAAAPAPVFAPAEPGRMVHEVKTEPVKVDTTEVTAAIAAQTRASMGLVEVVSMLVQQMAQQRQAAPTPRPSWRFEIERDADGRIASINATQD